MARAPAGGREGKLYYLVKQASCSNTLWLKPPASCRFSAADGQAPAAPGPSSPTMGGGGGGSPRPAQGGPSGCGLCFLSFLQVILGAFPSATAPPAEEPHLNSTWELRLRPIRVAGTPPGVTPRRPVPRGGGPVITATVFDEKPDPHNFWVTKQTRVSAWGLVAAERLHGPFSIVHFPDCARLGPVVSGGLLILSSELWFSL